MARIPLNSGGLGTRDDATNKFRQWASDLNAMLTELYAGGGGGGGGGFTPSYGNIRGNNGVAAIGAAYANLGGMPTNGLAAGVTLQAAPRGIVIGTAGDYRIVWTAEVQNLNVTAAGLAVEITKNTVGLAAAITIADLGAAASGQSGGSYAVPMVIQTLQTLAANDVIEIYKKDPINTGGYNLNILNENLTIERIG